MAEDAQSKFEAVAGREQSRVPGAPVVGPKGEGEGLIIAGLDDGLWSFLSWLNKLYRLGQRIALTGDVSEIHNELLMHIVAGFNAVSGSLAISNSNNTLTLVTGIEVPAHVIGKQINYGEGIMGVVAQDGVPLLLNGDLSQDPRFNKVSKRGGSNRSYHSSMCWPLTVDKKIIGVLNINRGTHQPEFTERDLERGTVLVSLISVVVENAVLHLDQQKRIDLLSKLNADLKEATHRLDDAQAQLIQSEKMASIGQLAAGLAHEINNPISFINSNIGILSRYLESVFDFLALIPPHESLSKDRLEKLQIARESLDCSAAGLTKEDVTQILTDTAEGVSRVRQIVQDMRVFSRIDHKEWQIADLHEGIDSTLNIVANEIRYKCEVVKNYGDLPRVECLSAQINQVIMNLIINAAQAIESQGTITISTGLEGNWVRLSISDTGPGIPKENLNKIFDPFFTTKPVGAGTGLGLSVSYGIVERHGGRIEVETQLGKGTKFSVWLPIKQSQVARNSEDATSMDTVLEV